MTMLRQTICGFASVLLLGVWAVAASAQDRPPLYATLIGVPLATGAPAGMGFVSLSGTTRRNPGSTGADGSAAFGLGFGNADDGVGVQVSAHITSLTDNFGDSGYLALKLSRRIEGAGPPTYIGLTVDHLVPWGDATVRDPGAAIAVTSFSRLQGANGTAYPVILSLGAGTNLTRNQTEPGIFAGLGVGLTPNIGASLALNGDSVELGAAWRPPGVRNMAVVVALSDALDQNNHRRVTLSVSYGLPGLFGGGR
jgi:hypothetical protein